MEFAAHKVQHRLLKTMDDNNDIDLSLDELDRIDADSAKKLQVKDRYAKLSENLTAERKAREEAEAKLKAQADAQTQLERERDFLKTFNQVAVKHPEAVNYQDQIMERVNKGIDTEEATVAVLFKEGKLAPMGEGVGQTQINAEGGSAMTYVGGDKSSGDLTASEKLSALADLEKSEGALTALLRPMGR